MSEVADRNRTGRVNHQEEMRLYRLLGASARVVVHARSERELLREICKVLVRTGGYRFAWAGYLSSGAPFDFRPLVHAGHDAGFLPTVSAINRSHTLPERGPEDQALRRGVPVVQADIEQDEVPQRWRQAALERGYRSAIALPLMREERVTGLLCVYAGEPHAFGEQERLVFREVAATLAYGIGALHVRQERNSALAALQDREETLRRIIEHEPDGKLVLDLDGRILFVNPATERLLGRSSKQLQGTEFGYPLVGGGWAEVTLLGRDGRPTVAEMRAVKTEWYQEPAYVVSIHDITDRKRYEEERAAHIEHLHRAMLQTVAAVASTFELRDPYTAGHHRKVSRLAAAIGREMGLSEEEVIGLRLGGSILDIGKIHIPAEILNRPGHLGEIEQGLIRNHPQTGYRIFKDTEFPWPIADMIMQHHERLDGSGYPAGLKNGEIRREARILAVADVVDAISAHRPYRPALGIDAALAEIQQHRERLFDPEVVDACLRLFREKGFSLDVGE